MNTVWKIHGTVKAANCTVQLTIHISASLLSYLSITFFTFVTSTEWSRSLLKTVWKIGGTVKAANVAI